MKRFLVTRGPDLALVGVGLAMVTSVVTALVYSGPAGEQFQGVNHTVSELGERGVSKAAPLFNAALVAGGLLIALFMLGLALDARDRGGRGFGLLGTLAGVAMALVGLFPVDAIESHLLAAALAFLAILVTSAWFVLWLFRGAAPYPRWLGWFAVWIAIAVVALMVLPAVVQPDYTFSMEFEAEPPPRPDIRLASILEWIVVASAWTWIAALAWHHRKTAQQEVT